MSLILDALNRARQNENAVPGLATQHPVEQLSARRRQYLLWAALAVAVAVIAALLVDRFRAPPAPQADIGAPVAELSRNIDSAVDSVTTELKARAAAAEQAQQAAAGAPAAGAPAAGTTVPAEPAAAAAVPDAAAQVAPAPAGAAPLVAATAEPAVDAATRIGAAQPVIAPEPAPETAVADAAAPAARRPRSAPPDVRDEAVARLYQNRDLADVPAKREPAPGVEPQGGERSAEVERILREARDEMENASLDEHPAPFLSDLSQRTKDGIPTLYYQRHDYSSDASQSSVTLNGNTVKTGGSILPGMKVEEILADSVVLNYQGTQFRLRALNSWINL